MFGRIKIIRYWAQKDLSTSNKKALTDATFLLSFSGKNAPPANLADGKADDPQKNGKYGIGTFFCKPAVFNPP